MPIPDRAITIAQKHLFAVEGANFPATGLLDPQTVGLLGTVLQRRKAELSPSHRAKILNGDGTRKMVAFLQLTARDKGVDAGAIDGLWGPSTQHAYDSLTHLEDHGSLPPLFRDEVPSSANPNGWPMEKEAKLKEFYGQVGKNQTTVTLPYTHLLSWETRTKVNSFSCNKKVAASIARVLEKVLAHYGKDGIHDLRLDLWGGCLNVRRKREGSSWSTHAWGVAIDYDPDNNRLKWGRDRATLAAPVYGPWWQFWEEEGWLSLGRTRNFDWMHVQAARL